MLINEILSFGALQNNPTCFSGKYNVLCYNIVQSAPALSQLAGVLASFVFATIVLALGNPPKNKTVKNISLPLLSSFTAFVFLLISCYLFGVVAGEETLVRAFIFGLAASLVFSLAALQLMLSIAWYFKSYEVELLVMRGAYWLIQSVLFIVVVHVIGSSGDVYVIATNKVWSAPWFNNPLLNTIAITMLNLIILYFLPWGIALFIRRKWKAQPKDNSSTIFSSPDEWSCGLALLISAILATIFTVTGAVYIEFPDQQANPGNTNIMWLVLISIVILLFFFFIPFQLGLPMWQQGRKNHFLKEETKQALNQVLSQPTEIVQAQPHEGTNLTQLQEQADSPNLQKRTDTIQLQKQIDSSQQGKQTSQAIPFIMSIGIPIIASAISIIINLNYNKKHKS